MENNKITRKDFLTNTSKFAIGAVVGVAGLNTLAGGKILANTKVTWPLPYAELDVNEARERGHFHFWNGKDCAAGVFGAIVELLSTKLGEPWTNIPAEIMLFGRGGGVGWGSLCGCLNGSAAIISSVVDKATSEALINEIWGWYCSEELPTEAANNFVYTTKNYEGTLPSNISGSPLCHSSVSQWCVVAKKTVSSTERKERCGRLTGDIAAKTVEVLNAHFAGTFTSTFTVPASVTACQGCHGSAALNNVMTKMDCEPCHGDPHKPTGGIESIPEPAKTYKLSQNYPNPFNPETKIQFSIPNESKVNLAIYDIQGALINTLIDHDNYSVGSYSVTWDGRDFSGKRVASGIYFARIEAGNFMKTIKMNLMK